ncbi:A disintegrin and metalloproteinase with thrombospondin motifs 20-like [Pseudorasbora parva]|uniref:A disintegrin and metalloproteinase with thrombospondin motifs 20-like n=1 Tax=Pseudorasbora parva TaxID=51549 RepID=UPI00351F6021
MRGPALRLLGLVWHLSALLRTAHTHKLHHKQESFIRQLSSYEIVTPVRLNDFGESFPHRLHYRRRRRSTEAEVSASRAHYRIEAFGQAFHLNLTADSGFIAPSYTVLHLGEEENHGGVADLRHCFFRGHVNAHSDHRAVFSLCTGLIGTFSTQSGQFFLEPLLKEDGEEYEEEHNKPHLVYRKSPDRKSPDPQPCTSSEHHDQDHISLHSNRTLEEEVMSIREMMQKRKYDSSHSHSRKRRFLSYPRFVELMVTADTKMVRHHGRNLEHYILTIMSVVAAIYRDPSVGNLINIMIIKLIVIHDEQEGPNINFYATATLHNFCVWQQSHNVLDDSHPSHHDTALLITREDICRAKDKCDTLGLAELGTMCDPYRSCSISEENGLSSSFTIAHELGHVFNMPHDDSPKCREAGVKHQYHVMAPTLNYDTSPWSWSKCSRKYVTDFLDTGYGECLLDEPSGRTYDLPNQLPGQLYNANRQCELMFGPGSQVCPFMKQCKRLWCTSAEGDHKGCRTQHMPLADGTECGYGMCSVSCGKGLKERQIVCVDQNQTQIEDEACAHQTPPRTRKACRAGPCPSWRANQWRACSVSCGAGSQSREVFCRLKGRGRVRDDLCDVRVRPVPIRSCFLSGCQTHTWTAHRWQDCNATCGRGVRSRSVFCQDGGMNVVSERMCDASAKPHKHEPCHSATCRHLWVTAAWSQCSVSCGSGVQRRAVRCSAVTSDLRLQSCSERPPADSRPCRLPACPNPGAWRAGPWSECSQTCGAGVMQRTVECVRNVPSEICSRSSRPESTATCRRTDCELHASCRELQMKAGVRTDGEHHIKLQAKILRVYCAEMQSEVPREYVTLRSQTENYSEVYGYRLQNPFECPFNGSRRQDCACRNDYAAAGYTVFQRVRLDLSTMRIITTDVKFSQTLFGRSVPFASAGDCYSAAKCPQGQFSINLSGTGLTVAESTKWVSQGNYVTLKVHRSEDGTRIYGRCGGFCGKCLPHPHTGLSVKIQ